MSSSKRNISIDIKKLTNFKSKKLLDSISNYFQLQQPQTYQPVMNKFTDIINNDKSLTNYIFKSKYRCCQITGIIDEEDDDDCSNFDENMNNNSINDNSSITSSVIEQDISNCIDILCEIEKNENKTYNQRAFVKISPLIDPIRILMDTYQIPSRETNWYLPNIYNMKTVNKVNSYNNSVYIETLFQYFASKLTENGLCPTYPYFYGGVNGIKDEYFHDISDEYSELKNKKWFNEAKGDIFELILINNENDDFDFVSDNDIDCNDDINCDENIECDEDDSKLNVKYDDNEIDEISKKLKMLDIDDELETFQLDSDTDGNIDTDDDNNDSDNDSDKLEVLSISSSSEIDIDDIDNSKLQYIKMDNFPVQLNILEYLPITLDQLLDSDYNMSNTEWLSIFFQISFGLAVAQKHFKFCHNDLHSSNIMFKPTKAKYLYYYINNNYYKIPTFGKITKIIDFARATFKYNNHWYFSDVFARDGEAEEQYSYPYKNSKNVENSEYPPNPSFDLVRFATTITERLDKNEKIKRLVNSWMITDFGNNIGDDEDDFELYINIARYCHNAVPIKVLKHKYFKQFLMKNNIKPNKEYIYYY